MISEEQKAEAKGHGTPQQGLQPRDACKCSPAMQAAIAEKADELGLWSGSDYSGYDGVLVIDNGSDRWKVRPTLFSTNPTQTLNFLTPAQFLTRLEHTSPPVKERTTEERFAEAVGLLDELLISAGTAYSNKADYNITRYYRCAKEVSTFLKSIKP